jgi:hypothetical protein
MVNWYLEVKADSIGPLNDVLAEHGYGTANPGGRLGFEVHYWTDRERAQAAADTLTARGYLVRAEATRA